MSVCVCVRVCQSENMDACAMKRVRKLFANYHQRNQSTVIMCAPITKVNYPIVNERPRPRQTALIPNLLDVECQFGICLVLSFVCFVCFVLLTFGSIVFDGYMEIFA